MIKDTALKICFIGWGDSIHTQRWMKWFVENGHQVYLITDRPSGADGVIEYDISMKEEYTGNRLSRYLRLEFNVYYIRKLLKILGINALKQIIAIIRTIWKIRPDILHLHTLLHPSNLGVFAGLRPTVVTPWNGDIVWKKDWSLLRKVLVKKVLHDSDLITVDSEELRTKVLKYGNYADKTEQIAFGVETGIFNPENKAMHIREKLNIPDRAPIVLSPRSLHDLYNIDIIISAIPLVLAVHPETIFVFCWYSESKKKELLDLVVRLKVESNVRFTGIVHDRVELANYYAEASVCVSIPSYDTIPVSLLEAMACGAAPVISDLPSPRECVENNVNGCVVPIRNVEATANVVTALLSDNKLRERMSERNVTLARTRYDWNDNMRKLEGMYYALCEKYSKF